MSAEETSEMQFSGGGNVHELDVTTHRRGSVLVEVSDDVETLGYALTLGQTIQLRDFLNRHIDRLALKQTGSLAVRSSDDPNQLAAVEDGSPSQLREPPSSEGCGKVLYGHHLNMVRCGGSRTARCTSCGGVFIPQGDE